METLWNKLNKLLKKMLIASVFCMSVFFNGLMSYADGESVDDAYQMTVYPGQTLVHYAVLETSSEGKSWSTSALRVRYGLASPWTFQNNIDAWQYKGDTAKLGGTTADPNTTGPKTYKYKEDDGRTAYYVSAIDNKSINVGNVANSAKMYMAFYADYYASADEGNPTTLLKEELSEGMFDMDVATKFYSIKSTANDQIYFNISDIDTSTGSNNLDMLWFKAGSSSNVKIYPDSYEDLIYAEESDIKKMIPWYKEYGNGKTSLTNNRAKEIYNQYGANSSYFNSEWVNDYWKKIIGTDYKFLYRNIKNYSYLRYASSWRYTISGTLSDLVDTQLNVSVDITRNFSEKNDETPYASLESGETVTSVFQISGDGTNFQNLTGSVQAKSFSFNMLDHSFKISGKTYEMPDDLKNRNTWYIRRISSAQSALGSYVNAVSPAMRIRPALSLDGLDVYYSGPAITEGGYMNSAYVKVLAHYSSGDVLYAGNGSYISYTNTRIMNVGNNNYVYYKYVDPKLKEVREGWFKVQGSERKPVSMTAVYEGPSVVIEKSYNPANLRITVTYNNGDIATFTGNSNIVGTLNSKTTYSVGDVDLTGAINSADVTALQNAIKAGNPFANDKKAFAQADVNGDGKVDDNDVTALKARVDGKIKKIGSNTFYATYSGLMDPKDNKKPLFATFYVTGINRSPYKLTIAKEPDKTTYIEGEDFDPTGMILAITYDNEEVTYINFDGTENTTGLKIGDDDHPSKAMAAGQTIVPLKFSENGTSVSANVRLTVRNKNLTSIKITSPAETLAYYAGENFNPSGMIVTAYYDEDVDEGKRVQSAVLESTEYTLSDNRKLKNGQEYVVIKSDKVDSSDADLTNMNGFVRIAKSDITSGPGTNRGDSGTWVYNRGGKSKTVSGQIVGDSLVKVTYTERSVTRYDYQPITVYARKLSSLTVQSTPFTTEYTTGQSFDSAGLILLATYTDGTSDYIYSKSDTRNGYVITNGDALTADRTTVTAQYTENEITKDVKVPITVIDPSIDGIQASYTGDSVYVGNSFDTKDVIIIVSYTNGDKVSFRANELNEGGSLRVKIVKPDEDGTIDSTHPQDVSVTEKGANTYAAIYSGHEALFTVNGIAAPDSLDFSGSIAENKRDYATWTEQFTSIKIKSVQDYIKGNADTINTGSSAEENHLVPEVSTTDTRTSLIQDEGTMKPVGTNLKSPLLSFLRQGTWIQPDNAISIQYKGRTDGYLFPEVNNEAFKKDNSYYDKYYQNRTAIAAADNADGWSDWVDNGDSIGTVLTDRIAYNYTGTGGDASNVQMNLGRMKFRLRNLPTGSNAYIKVECESVNGVVSNYTYTASDDTDKIVMNPARLKITLGGTITVKNNQGGTDTVNFADEYKVYYRATTDDAAKWAKTGEWTGYSGVPVQDFELRLMQKDAWFDEGSASDRPVITENPRNTTVVIGYATTLTVKAVGNDLSYQWYKNGEAISGAVSNSYTTPELYKDDDGNTYYCMVSSSTASTNSAVAMVTVKDEYPALTQNITNIEGEVGDRATLTVQAYCRVLSDLTFDWEMTDSNGEFKPFVSQDRSDADGISTIGFVLTSDMHGRRIRCKVSNTIGSVYSNAVQVNCSMNPEIELYYTSDHVTVSKSQITITAATKTSATGGIKNYLWTLNGSVQANANTEKMSFVPSKEGSYLVTCKATDDFGSVTKDVTIYVGKAPSVALSYKKDDSAKYTGRKTVTITATLTASELANKVNISWSMDGKTLSNDSPDVTVSADGKTLTMDNVANGDQFTVTCRVNDNYGDAGKIIAIS